MANGTEEVKQPETIADLPDQTVASETVGQPLHQAGDSAVDFEKLLSHPGFQAALDKKVQSVKDVRFGKMETEVKDIRGSIAKYDSLLKQGLSPDQAVARMEGDDKVSKLEKQVASLLSGNKPEVSVGTGEQDWAGKQASILENAGIAKDDPRITELLRTAESKQDFVAKLDAATFDWKQEDAKKPQPNANTVASIIPSVAPSGDIQGAYNKELQALRKGDISGISALKTKYRKLGLEVW